MSKRIKITRTQTLVYNPADQDQQEYSEEGVVNIDMAALQDVKWLEQGEFDWSDLVESADDVEEDEFKITIVEQENGVNVTEREVDERNTTRDEDLFPDDEEDEDEEDEEDDEAPVAGELNAGGEAYGNF
jgi:hypothetical protein